MSEDLLKDQWACLSCFAKFPMGKLMINGGVGERSDGNMHGFNCPHCRSMNVHPADGKTHVHGDAA